ncbi:MAG: hypothetical protein U0939_07980 [Pirellulales bacterium]
MKTNVQVLPQRPCGGRPAWLPAWLFCVIAMGCLTASVRAEYLASASAPAAGAVNRSGLVVRCETQCIEGAGYTPIRVTIADSAGIPLAKSRTIHVSAFCLRHPSNDVVSRTIVVPEGAASRTETIYLPLGQAAHWNTLQFTFVEGGRELSDLRCAMPFRNQRFSPQLELEASMLFLDDDAPAYGQRRQAAERLLKSQEPAKLPDMRGLTYKLCGRYENGAFVQTQSTPDKPEARTASTDGQVVLELARFHAADLIPTSELPIDWRELANFTVVFTPWPELERITAANDGRWTALRRWISAGGTLIVYDMGRQFSRLRDLEPRVGLSSLPALVETDKTPGWTAPQAADWGKEIAGSGPPNRSTYVVSGPFGTQQVISTADVAPSPDAEKTDEKQPPPKRPDDSMNFVSRELGLGLVVAIDAPDPLPGHARDWDWMFGQIGDQRFRPGRKLGITRLGENPDFANFLVRNVGQAPVWMFLTLITLFVVLIGPVNYFVLRRRRRLYMLLVTVPGAAAVVTATLVVYAVLADGLHVRSRIRSVTHIDQIGRTSSSWSRQVYFAGLTPAGGLTYPADAFVQPIDRWGLQDERRSRHMEWTDEVQSYRQGYIAPRTMSQMLVIDPHPTTIGLRIRVDGSEEGGCRVRNELGVGLSRVLIRDEQGRYYHAPRLEAGEEKMLPRVDPNSGDFARDLRDFGDVAKLDPPQWNDSRTFRRVYYYYSSQVSVTTSTSLMEQGISRFNVLLREMPRRGYLAVADEPLETPAGADAREKQPDVNFVIGAW